MDEWAAVHPRTAQDLAWSQRRRRRLFEQDLLALGGGPLRPGPVLPGVPTTAAALGRLYVLEGSSLGGQVINASLAARDGALSVVRLRGLSPYGDRTGAMWRDYRRIVATWPVEDADVVVASAVETFVGLEAWVAPLAEAR